MDTNTQSQNPPEADNSNGQLEKQEVATLQISSFEEGIINGVLKTDTQPFLNFIEHTERADLAKEQIQINRHRIIEREAEYTTVKAELLKWKKIYFENSEADRLQEEKISYLNQERRDLLAQAQKCREKVAGIKLEFPLISSLLFLLAAFVFIASDIFYTKEVVGFLFNLKPVEGWIISIGLAFSAFIIKPSIDRILEKPYREGRRIIRVHVFYIIIGAVVVVMLAFLGYLRVEGTIFQALKRDRELLLNILNGTPASALFIMSSVLFAVAGAICLSIAMPNIGLYWTKFSSGLKIRYIGRSVKMRIKKIEKLRSEQNQYRIALQEADLHVSLLKPIKIIEDEWNTLVEESDNLLKKYKEHKIASEQEIYMEGYERGSKFNLNGELSFSPYQVLKRIFNASNALTYIVYQTRGKSNTNKNQQPLIHPPDDISKKTQGGRRGHLHQEIRRMIDFTFTRNQNDFYEDQN